VAARLVSESRPKQARLSDTKLQCVTYLLEDLDRPTAANSVRRFVSVPPQSSGAKPASYRARRVRGRGATANRTGECQVKWRIAGRKENLPRDSRLRGSALHSNPCVSDSVAPSPEPRRAVETLGGGDGDGVGEQGRRGGAGGRARQPEGVGRRGRGVQGEEGEADVQLRGPDRAETRGRGAAVRGRPDAAHLRPARRLLRGPAAEGGGGGRGLGLLWRRGGPQVPAPRG
jgi:hypothetical protein